MIKFAKKLLNYYRQRRILSLGTQARFVRVDRGFFMRIDPSQSMDKAYFLGVYEREMIAVIDKLVKAGDTVMDIGTHKGYVSCNMARAVGPDGMLVSIDADPRVYAELVANCAQNGFSWAKTFNCAVGSEPTTWEFHLSEDLGNSSRFPNEIARDRVASTIQVQVRPAIEIFQETGGSRLDFVKIDAEGAEPLVLAGMTALLEQFHPSLYIEINKGSLAAAGCSAGDIELRMQQFGYSQFRVEWKPLRGLRFVPIASLMEVEQRCFEVLFCHPDSSQWPSVQGLQR